MSPSGAASFRGQSAARGWFISLLVIVLLAPTVFAGLHTLGKACFTEASERGRCVPVKRCGYIADTLRQKNHTHEDIQFLYGSVCGKLPDQRVLVCCVSALVAGPSRESTTESVATGVRGSPVEPTNSQPSEWPLPEQSCGAEASARMGNIEGHSIGYHPWSVLLHYGNRPFETKFPCTGTLISDRFVLTSAGCVAMDETRANLTARVGEYDLESTIDCLFANETNEFFCAKPSEDVPVAQVLLPPGFSRHRNDIALLKLSYPVELNEWVTPICLPSAASIVNETVPLHAASWNQNPCAEAANRHKVLSTYGVTNQPACRRQRLPGQEDTSQDFLCVSAAGGPFAVDSGGALTGTKRIAGGAQGSRTVHELIGVLSSVTNCANYEGVLLYTKVGHHLDWIGKMLAQANEEATEDEEERVTTMSSGSFGSGNFT